MPKGDLTITLNERDYENMMTALSQLTLLEQNAVIQKGLQEGIRLFVKQGKSNLNATLSQDPHNVKSAAHMAAKRGGSLKNSFSTKTKKKQGKGYAGFSKYGHHAHLVSDGTKKRYTTKGYYRGSVSKNAPMTGSRFWRTAFEQKKNAAAQELMDSVKLSIYKIVNRNR